MNLEGTSSYFGAQEEAVRSLNEAIKIIKKMPIKTSVLYKPLFYLNFNRFTGELLRFFPQNHVICIKYQVKRNRKIVQKGMEGEFKDLTKNGQRLIKAIEVIIASSIRFNSSLSPVKRKHFEQVINSKAVGTYLKFQCGFDLVAGHADVPYTKGEKVLLLRNSNKLIIAQVKKVYSKKLSFEMGSGRRNKKVSFKKLPNQILYRTRDQRSSENCSINICYHEAKIKKNKLKKLTNMDLRNIWKNLKLQ